MLYIMNSNGFCQGQSDDAIIARALDPRVSRKRTDDVEDEKVRMEQVA